MKLAYIIDKASQFGLTSRLKLERKRKRNKFCCFYKNKAYNKQVPHLHWLQNPRRLQVLVEKTQSFNFFFQTYEWFIFPVH